MWTQADVDNLKTVIASGTLTVIYDGPPKRQITYQSLGQMRALLAAMVSDLARQAGTPRNGVVATSKGFDPSCTPDGLYDPYFRWD